MNAASDRHVGQLAMSNLSAFRTAVICLLTALSGGDRAAAVRQSPADTGSAVMAFERARTTAVRQRDERAYRRLASPDLTIVNPDGTLLGRDERLVEVRAG